MAELDILKEIESLENSLAGKAIEIQKVRGKLARARKNIRDSKDVGATLQWLANELRRLPQQLGDVELHALATTAATEAKVHAGRLEQTFLQELQAAANAKGMHFSRAGNDWALGPFLLKIDSHKELASLEYGKLPVGPDLALIPEKLVIRVEELSTALLPKSPASEFLALAKDFEEAIKVNLVRNRKSLIGDLRGELPAVYCELTFIKNQRRPAANTPMAHYSIIHFVVELKTLVQSEWNASRVPRFRLEQAVLENTRNPKKSLFVPADLTKGYGEGTYFQAVILTGAG